MLEQIEMLENEILEKKKQLAELRKSVPDRQMEEYLFEQSTGKEISLKELFRDNDELIVIHNMGRTCSYCTMWADGFNGVYPHIKGKASFVLASPDSPQEQEDFAASRQWQFPMISVRHTSFTSDIGFQEEDSYHPGLSVFYKDENGEVHLYSQAPLLPGDDFCSTWHLFDLLPSGSSDVKVNRRLNEKSQFQMTNNIAMGINNSQEAIVFYRNVLGMKVEEEFDNETKLTVSGTNFYMENSEQNDVFFEFAVEDFSEALALLKEHGCNILKEYNNRSVMIEDPYGMKFHLFECE